MFLASPHALVLDLEKKRMERKYVMNWGLSSLENVNMIGISYCFFFI